MEKVSVARLVMWCAVETGVGMIEGWIGNADS